MSCVAYTAHPALLYPQLMCHYLKNKTIKEEKRERDCAIAAAVKT